ncbi:hypothetical protein JG687_00004441 [Phytophthora cactorum]|uniref:Cyclic nucleotide-binding domain-containing protein n=1 Tax=Phytophthora cactorum TaxID=29920 RepID=A0A8T1UP00_9STRA|nr:hypothetical protein JG687_00004441 [Phytophthora cactorum]
MTGLVQILAKNLEWWQRGTAIDPDWPFVGIWEATMLMVSTVQGTLVMFYICFGANETSSGRAFADAVTITLELLFVLDVYLHLHLGFYEYGNKVMDLAVIQKRYLRSMHFAIDMAALLQPMIVKVAFLVGMEDSVTRMLVSLFTQVLFVKDEFICHFGEEGSEMFFIYTGVLDIYIPFLSPSSPTHPGSPIGFPTSASGARVSLSGLRKVNEITAGSYFGEAALFTNTPRNANNSSDFNVSPMKHKPLMQEVEVDAVGSSVLAFAVTAFVKKSRTFVPASQINFSFAIAISFIGQLVMALMIAEMANIFLLYIDNEVQFRKNHLTSHSYFSLVLATAQLAVSQKKTTAEFVTDWFNNDDEEEEEENKSSDSSNDDDSDGKSESGVESEQDQATADVKLRRRSRQLKQALQGASQETMNNWEETFALFMEMLVPKGSMETRKLFSER